MLSLKKKANKRESTLSKKTQIKVDFSHVGPVFLLDSRNFGKSTFFFTFFSRFLR